MNNYLCLKAMLQAEYFHKENYFNFGGTNEILKKNHTAYCGSVDVV